MQTGRIWKLKAIATLSENNLIFDRDEDDAKFYDFGLSEVQNYIHYLINYLTKI